jgi:hypothetical protein
MDNEMNSDPAPAQSLIKMKSFSLSITDESLIDINKPLDTIYDRFENISLFLSFQKVDNSMIGYLKDYLGGLYYGEYDNNSKIPKGRGVLFVNESMYVGIFDNSGYITDGYMKFKDNSFFMGKFIGELKISEGYYQFDDGSTYNGTLLNYEMTGQGSYKWKDGRSYIGEWLGAARSMT